MFIKQTGLFVSIYKLYINEEEEAERMNKRMDENSI